MIPERPASLGAAAGVVLQAALAVPAGAAAGVVLCHPHPLYGGDMDNPVVVRAAEVCREAGLATLRFNFRGVGASTGVHDGGRGEQDDVRTALAHLGARLAAPARVALVGYSFGATVAAAVAARGAALAGLALIAPPLAFPGLERLEVGPVGGPVLVVAGSEDPYCPLAALEPLRARLPAGALRVIDGANHFFFGRLHPLGEAIREWAKRVAG